MSFLVHPCTTCRGTGSLTIGADYERRGNLYRDEEVCPTCDGEGAVFEYDGESEADAQAPVPDSLPPAGTGVTRAEDASRGEPLPAHIRGLNQALGSIFDMFAKAGGWDREGR